MITKDEAREQRKTMLRRFYTERQPWPTAWLEARPGSALAYTTREEAEVVAEGFDGHPLAHRVEVRRELGTWWVVIAPEVP